MPLLFQQVGGDAAVYPTGHGNQDFAHDADGEINMDEQDGQDFSFFLQPFSSGECILEVIEGCSVALVFAEDAVSRIGMESVLQLAHV